MANSTFTIRISPEEHKTLNDLAGLRHQSVSELARQLISEGIGRMLDPDEIDRLIEEERARLKDVALQVRKRAGMTPVPTNPTPKNGVDSHSGP
ncbi:DUF6290 family protein [Rhodococcus sp. UFZ-B548]|uniref:DUF6290 family protein n=1 Tax=Rhodococcus sp. UFZ-B548 TaxID=2742212 RepID=UPI0015F48E39|nr:DUF6290 family protein [Rhodococcus sp. UFZ-B548]